MRRRPVAAPLVAGLLLSGCATSDHMYLVDREVHCSVTHGPIEFLGESPTRPYVAVARIEAPSMVFVPTSWESLRLHLCREALDVDADAVIALEQGDLDYSVGFTPFKLDWTNKRLKAVAIRSLEPGERLEDAAAVPALGADGEPIEASETVQHDSDEQSR